MIFTTLINSTVSALRWLKNGVFKLATRFTNVEFYAELVNGRREPVSTTVQPDPGPIENPDPGGDGGGSQNPGGDQGGNDQGTGGDVGNPAGTVTTTTGAAPVLTRKSHNEDIFAPKGIQFSITYVSDRDCTFIPKKGFKQGQTETVSDDGREFTISFTPSFTTPGDSYYIGCKAEVYGDDGQVSSTTIYDIVHIAKSPSDIIRIGKGTSHEVLQNALEDSSIGYTSGCTVIVEPGYYDDDRDYIHVGQFSARDVIPNGVRGEVVTKIVYGPDAVTPFQVDGVDVTENIQRTTKYTTIMSRQPYAAIIDRKNVQRTDIEIMGNYRRESGQGSYAFREVFGIAVKGFACRNTTYNSRMEKVDSCKITDCTVMQSITAGQYAEQNNNAFAFFADGGMVNTRSVRNCTVESVTAIANTRAGLFTSSGGYFNTNQYLDATMYCRFKNLLLTHGTYQPFGQTRSQTFLGYGARYVDIINCWALDSKFFIGGYRASVYDGGTVSPNDHFSFQITNGAAEQFRVRRFLAMNDTRGGIKLDQGENTFEGRTTIEESVFWGKAAGISRNGMMDIRSFTEIKDVTVGKVENAPNALVHRELELTSNGVLILNPTWDYAYPTSPNLFEQPFNLGTNSSDDYYCLVSDNPSNTKMNALDNSLFIDRANTASSGAKYLGRIDPGTNIANFGAGCTNIFADELRTETEYLDNDATVYDGRNGNKYINAYSRECWEEWQRERRLWETTVDGVLYSGRVGWCEQEGINPTDYINRQGTSPTSPTNCPFIDDIYGKVVGTDVKLWWRPVCAPYRNTITGYDIYIDRIKVASDQPKEATQATLTNVASGTRIFEIVVKDSTFGDSGFSREVRLTIP